MTYHHRIKYLSLLVLPLAACGSPYSVVEPPTTSSAPEVTVPTYEVTCDAFEATAVVCVDGSGDRWVPQSSISTVGGTLVPSWLDCEEDEVIAFTGPDTLGCVHIEAL